MLIAVTHIAPSSFLLDFRDDISGDSMSVVAVYLTTRKVRTGTYTVMKDARAADISSFRANMAEMVGTPGNVVSRYPTKMMTRKARELRKTRVVKYHRAKLRCASLWKTTSHTCRGMCDGSLA